MTKLFGRGSYAQVLRINGSIERLTEGLTSDQRRVVSLNGTVIEVRLHEPYRDSQLNELLYVIIVIVFYATALMTLIITQIKRQRREGTEIDYYDEYLQRNSEVKRTCQTATSIVSRQGQGNAAGSGNSKKPPPKALVTAAFAAAAAGTLLGRTPDLPPDDIPPNSLLLNQEASGYSTEGASGGGTGDISCPSSQLLPTAPGASGVVYSVHNSPRPSRDRSPMLESIPDEEFC